VALMCSMGQVVDDEQAANDRRKRADEQDPIDMTE